MKVWTQWFAIVTLAAIVVGCTSGGGGAAGPEAPAVAPQALPASADAGAVASVPEAVTPAKDASGAASAVAVPPAAAPADAEGGAGTLVPPRPTLADKLQRTRPASAEAAGLDSFKDFEGKRIGFVHTANVVGEIDPCG